MGRKPLISLACLALIASGPSILKAGPIEVIGDLKVTGNVIFSDNSTQNAAAASIPGPAGPKGDPGPAGPQGSPGVAYARIVVVSPTGSDLENGTALLNALAGITGASATNPYLLKIEPGIYDIAGNSLMMKEYVDIEGSGEKTTLITGSISLGVPELPSNGVVTGANNAEIRFISVKNTGAAGAFAAALVNSGASPKITHVTAITSGSSLFSYGIINSSASSPTMTDVTATVSGGGSTYGIANISSSPIMTNIKSSASTSGASGNAVAFFNNASSPIMMNITASATAVVGTVAYAVTNVNASAPVMTNVVAAASGGGGNYAIRNDYSSPVMSNITATATGGTASVGMQNISSAPTISNVSVSAKNGTITCVGLWNLSADEMTSIYIDRSTFDGCTSIVNNANFNLHIGASKLIGGVNGEGTYKCMNVYSGSYDPLGSTCQPVPP